MIDASGLSKRYGATLAVDDLSFTVPPGHVTGFLGPNGSGKSTTMRLILGLDAPSSGSVSNGISRTRVDQVLDLVGLGSAARKRAGGFSLGMGQRLGIAAALLGDPPVLMLDEPVNGLDPEGVLWIRNLLKSLAAEGRTVLLCSHLMSEMSLTADRLIIIGRGRLIAHTAVADFLDDGPGNFVRVRSPQSSAFAALLEARGITITRQADNALRVTGATGGAVGELARVNGLTLQELSEHQTSLEDRYMELTSSSVDYRTAETALARARD